MASAIDNDTGFEQLSRLDLSYLREMIEKHKIYENVVKYCRGLDRFDIDLLHDSYWPDASDDHGAYVGTGWGFSEWTVDNKDSFKSCNHHIGNTQIELLGDQAKVETYFFVVIVFNNPDGNGDVDWLFGGRYKDLYERRNGNWKILRRVCIWDWDQEHPHRSNWSRGGIPKISNYGSKAPTDPIYGEW
jgi:SnoaL-like domain